MKSYALRVAVVLTLLAVAAFVVLSLFSLGGDLASAPAIERPWWLVAGVFVLAVVPLTYALLWRDIVCRLDGVRPPLIDSLAVFCASWLGRYVPSSIPYLAGKFAMGLRLGHGKRALGASMLYENVLLISVGAVSSSLIIPIALAGRGADPLVYVGAGLAGLAGLSLLSPGVIQRVANVATRVLRRPPIEKEDLLSPRGVAAGVALAAFALAVTGAGFALVLASLVDLSARELAASAAIYNLAGVAGILALPVPSGLGVREAVIIGLLQLFVPIEVAAAAAVLARFAATVIDILLGVAGAAVFALRRRREDAVQDQPAAAHELKAA